jgi:hypothetical protein
MSIDARYQRVSDPVGASSFLPHAQLVWEQIYSGWESTDYQYYWRQWDLDFSEHDTSYHERRDQLAFEMAAAGDERARSTLQRIVARDPDAAKRERASELLANMERVA